jgi:hypothetical protein
MQLLGVRDFATATALAWLGYEDNRREMGIVITSWLTVCVVDIVLAAQGPRGINAVVLGLIGGSGVVAFIGLGLLQC